MAKQTVRYLVKTWSSREARELGPLETWLNEGAKLGAELVHMTLVDEGAQNQRATCVFSIKV